MRRAAKSHAKAKRAVEDAAVDHTLERDKERQNEPEKPEHPISSCDLFPSSIGRVFGTNRPVCSQCAQLSNELAF